MGATLATAAPLRQGMDPQRPPGAEEEDEAPKAISIKKLDGSVETRKLRNPDAAASQQATEQDDLARALAMSLEPGGAPAA